MVGIKESQTLDFQNTKSFSYLSKVDSFDQIRNQILTPYSEILNNLEEVYIFGAKRLGEKAADCLKRSGIKVKAFIDNDLSKHGTLFCDKQIIALDSVKTKGIPIIISTTNYLYEISSQLNERGLDNHVSYPVLSIYDSEKYPAETTFKDMQQDLIANKQAYLSLFSMFADKKSQKVLDNILNFRLTLDPACLDICDSQEDEYFDTEIMPLGDDEVFIDGGGYDGDTVLRFIEKTNNNYKKIHLFEPDARLCNKAAANLADYRDIDFVKRGLYSSNKTLRFTSTGDVDGFIDPDGDLEINVVALDNYIKEEISFLKLDVEGAEEEALIGAKNHLKNNSPKLAVAVYHQSQDLWKIPSLITSINSKYQEFYLRNYSRTSLDIVLYGIPK